MSIGPRSAPLAPGGVNVTPDRVPTPGKLQIGVIGAGNFAQSMLLPHLKDHPNATLHSIANRTPLTTRDAAERFGIGKAYSNPDEILNDPAVQAVLITTRHDSHAHLALQALQAGKAIHLEKPLVVTPEELDEVTAAYQAQKNAFLMVGFNRRFAPLVQEMEKFYAGRREPLAMICRVNAGFLPLDHWTQDAAQGGRIIGEACHFIDLLQYFARSRPTQVYASGLPNLGKYRDDNVSISLTFADGSVGTVLYVANGDKSVPKEYLEISGEGKTAILTDYRHVSLMSGGRTRTSKQAQDKGHRAEMLAWVDALRAGQGEPLPFAEAVQTMRATFGAVQSLAEGKVIGL